MPKTDRRNRYRVYTEATTRLPGRTVDDVFEREYTVNAYSETQARKCVSGKVTRVEKVTGDQQ